MYNIYPKFVPLGQLEQSLDVAQLEQALGTTSEVGKSEYRIREDYIEDEQLE